MYISDVHFLRYVVSYFLKILLKAHSHAHLFPKNGIKFAKKLIAFCSYYIKYDTVKPVLSGHLNRTPKLVSNTNYCLIQVKSIAECSKGSILQYF